MTHPMPGPPECVCGPVPEHLWTTHYGAVDPATQIEYSPECPLHGEVSSDKPLTDAECAAEYWRAELTDFVQFGSETAQKEADTWHRFATHPHAHKDTL